MESQPRWSADGLSFVHGAPTIRISVRAQVAAAERRPRGRSHRPHGTRRPRRLPRAAGRRTGRPRRRLRAGQGDRLPAVALRPRPHDRDALPSRRGHRRPHRGRHPARQPREDRAGTAALPCDGPPTPSCPCRSGGTRCSCGVALDGDESHAVVAGGARACLPMLGQGPARSLFAAFGFTCSRVTSTSPTSTPGEERRLTRANLEDVLAELASPPLSRCTSPGGIDGAPVEGWFLQPGRSRDRTAD